MRDKQEIPDGYELSTRMAGFSLYAGPFYRREVDGQREFALFIAAQHCNPEGFLHGGMVSTFADYVMYQTIAGVLGEDSISPTITMTVNFVSGAKLGQILRGVGTVTKQTRSLMFTQTELLVEDQLVAHATGVYKIMR